jgi:hypothetical protein
VETWKDLSNIPFPAALGDRSSTGGLAVKELSLRGQLSLAQLRRLSVVKQNQRVESDDEV